MLASMAAMQRGLDVPGMVTTFTAANPARDGVVARVEQLLSSELLALVRRHLHASRGGLQGDALGREADRDAARARLQRGDGRRRLRHRVHRPLQGRQRHAPTSASSSSTTRCAARRAPSTATSTARRARSASPPRWPSPSTSPPTSCPAPSPCSARRPRSCSSRRPRRVMHKANVFYGMDVIVRSHASNQTGAAGAGLRHLLPEHRRREVHLQRRAGAPDDRVERPQRADRGAAPVQQHRRRARQHAARDAHPGRDHRGRRRAQRRARPRPGRLLHPLSRRGLPQDRCASSSTTPPRRRRWPPAPR